MSTVTSLPLPVRVLGLSGLLPQAACLGFAVLGVQRPAGVAGLFYAALILSFLGGLWWMAALLAERRERVFYLLAVMPSLLAWAVLLAQGLGEGALAPGLALVALCLMASPLVDRHLARHMPLPPGWTRLRMMMATGLAGLTLLLAVVVGLA